MRVLGGIAVCAVLLISVSCAQTVDLGPIQIIGGGAQSGRWASSDFSGSQNIGGDFSGVDIQSRVGYGFLQDVSIRGGIFEDTSVSLNGIPLNNPQTGHFHMSLPAVSSDLQTADVELNSQAINFSLKEPRADEVYWRSSAGNGGFAEQVVSLTKKTGQNFHRFSAEGMRTDGLRDETDGYRAAGSYLFRRTTDDRNALIYAAVSEKKFGENGAYAAPWYMREQEYLKQELLTGSWTVRGEKDIVFTPFFHRTQNTFWLDRDAPSFYRNDHTTYVSGQNVEIADTVSGKFAALKFERQDIRSTNLGTHNRFLYSAETGLKLQRIGRWHYDGALKAAYFDAAPARVLPRVYAGYDITPFWKAHARAERLFRQPSFTELYYHSPSNIGNSDLELQRSDNFETGLKYTSDTVWGGLNFFLRRQKDTIDWVRNAGDTVFQAVNAGRINTRGFDVSAGMKCSLGVFDQASVAYTFIDLDRKSAYDISKYAFDYLRHRAVLKLESRKSRVAYGLAGVFESHVALGDRWIVNAEAAYQIHRGARIFIAAENLFDERYDEFLYIQGEPLFIKTGLEMRF